MRDADGKLVEGVFDDVPMSEYLKAGKLEGDEMVISSGGLKEVDRNSPFHFREGYAVASDDKGTARSRLGSLTHCVLLEPNKLDSDFIIKPEPDPNVHTKDNGDPSTNPQNTKRYREAVAALVELHPGKELVEHPSLLAAQNIRDTIMGNPEFLDAAALIEAEGRVELTTVARDPQTGLLCKARIDKYLDSGIDVNVKGCRSVEYRRFQKDVFNFGHYISCGFYRMVMGWAGLPWANTILLALELDPPHAAKAWRMDEGVMDAGEKMARVLLDRVARCVERDQWPAYGPDVQSITLSEHQYTIVDEKVEQYGN